MSVVSDEAMGARTNPLVDFFAERGDVAPLKKGNLKGLPFSQIVPSDYEDAISKGIEKHNSEIKSIVENPEQPTFANTIVALDRAGSLLNGAVLTLSNLESALGDTVLMNITSRMMPLVSEHSTSVMLNEKLWDRVKKVYDSRNQIPGLNGEDMRLIEETYKGFVSSGANLKGADREKYRKLSKELSDLQVKFSQNVTNGMSDPAVRLWLEKDQLAGIPKSVVDASRAEAAEVLAAEGKADDGSLYLFTVFFPSYSPLMKYADNRDVREKMYRLYNSRNQSGALDNRQILKDIANIRLEIANLFGYDTYAAYNLTNQMAGSPENVYELLHDLRNAYMPAMKSEIKEIEDFAKAKEGDQFKLMPWDYSYWADKLKNERYAFNDEDMRPYFELDNSIKGVFGLATRLYGYQFKPNSNVDVYHPDVRAFDVLDEKGNPLGLLYADFYHRPGKGPGAWMTEFRGEYKDEEGDRSYPIISIVTNFTKPVGSEPSLLTPYEVETFLHEFGHALHGLSADTKYCSLSGTNVYRDFVELFSQFNENYLPQKTYLDGFAKHYKTGRKMPAELIDKFVKSSQFGAAYACIRQLNFGELDMAYHMIKEPLRASSEVKDFESVATAPVRIFDEVEGTMISPTFGHIFSGGYAAGYYGYKWSEVLDADAFSLFQENGIFDRKTADKFRKMLKSGGTVDPMALYIEFRGKKPTVDALMRRDGIKK